MPKAVITILGSLLVIVFVTVPMLRSWMAVKASRRNQPPEGIGYILLLRYPFTLSEAGLRSRLSGYFGEKFEDQSFKQVNQGTYTFNLAGDLYEIASLFDVYHPIPHKEKVVVSPSLEGNWMDHHAHFRVTCWGTPNPELREARLQRSRSLIAVLWPAESLALVEMHSANQVSTSPGVRQALLDGDEPAWDSEKVWFLKPQTTP